VFRNFIDRHYLIHNSNTRYYLDEQDTTKYNYFEQSLEKMSYELSYYMDKLSKDLLLKDAKEKNNINNKTIISKSDEYYEPPSLPYSDKNKIDNLTKKIETNIFYYFRSFFVVFFIHVILIIIQVFYLTSLTAFIGLLLCIIQVICCKQYQWFYRIGPAALKDFKNIKIVRSIEDGGAIHFSTYDSVITSPVFYSIKLKIIIAIITIIMLITIIFILFYFVAVIDLYGSIYSFKEFFREVFSP
jgi:hypothetical protein